MRLDARLRRHRDGRIYAATDRLGRTLDALVADPTLAVGPWAASLAELRLSGHDALVRRHLGPGQLTAHHRRLLDDTHEAFLAAYDNQVAHVFGTATDGWEAARAAWTLVWYGAELDGAAAEHGRLLVELTDGMPVDPADAAAARAAAALLLADRGPALVHPGIVSRLGMLAMWPTRRVGRLYVAEVPAAFACAGVCPLDDGRWLSAATVETVLGLVAGGVGFADAVDAAARLHVAR